MLKTTKLPTEIFHKETNLVFFDGEIIEEEQCHFLGVEKDIIKDLKIFTYNKSGDPIYSFDF